MKLKVFFIPLLYILSCNSLDNSVLDKLSSPCDCMNEKLKLYYIINNSFNNNFDSISKKKISSLDIDLVDEFSQIFKHIQKLEEIDFKIKLNSWDSEIKNCKNYSIYRSFKEKYN